MNSGRDLHVQDALFHSPLLMPALMSKGPLMILLLTFSVLDVRLSHAVMEPWLLEDPEYDGIITNANQKTDTLNGFVS